METRSPHPRFASCPAPGVRELLPQVALDEGAPLRAALYLRVSREEQQRLGYSLAGQEHDLRAYAARKGHRVVRILKEVGSGRNPGRPRMQQLLRLAEQGAFDLLLIWKRDRFGRSTAYNDLMAKFLERQGVRVESMMVGPQPTNAMTKFLTRMEDAVAELESDTIGERTHAGKLQKAREGHWPERAPPGWTRTYPEGLIVVDDVVAARIRSAYNAAAAGKSVRDIAHILGTRSHVSAVYRLHNPAYYGEALYCGIAVPMPPIVSKELWQRAQHAIAARKRNQGRRGAGQPPRRFTPRTPMGQTQARLVPSSG